MAKVIIYEGPNCVYCARAKALLDKLGIPYTTIDISTNPDLVKEMVDKSGGRTSVPQIFIDDKHIGGFDDLYALYRTGNLDKYL